MEDAATAEISRTQVWQWIHHDEGILDDGTEVTSDLFRDILAEELEKIPTFVDPVRTKNDRFEEAAQLFDRISTDDDFVVFLTLPGYEYLD
jgi:malate synthase